MNHAKKMVLVPENTLERLQRRQNVSTPPLTSRLNGLDQDIQNVLKDDQLSDDEKVRQYTQTLHNYLHYYNERKNQPVNVKIQQPTPTVKETTEETPQESRTEPQPNREDLEQKILGALPKTLKDPGKKLLEKIKENPEIMKWDDKGQLVLDGKSQQGTHISDLIKDSLRATRKASPGPLGWEMFTQGLAKMNAPDYLVRNSQRKTALRNYKKSGNPEPESNEWFPTPLAASPGPMKKPKARQAKKEMQQRWLSFRP